MITYPLLKDVQDLHGKRVLLRAGFDVPIENGVVADSTRVEALLPTMRFVLKAGASLVILSHQGRPQGRIDPAFTQKPLVPILEKLLKTDVQFASSCTGRETLDMAMKLSPGNVLLLENLRYDPREEKNDAAFGLELAALGDVYVNDAFTNCHRAHASMVRLPALLPAYMGFQLAEEVSHLSKVLEDPRRPLTLIVSGAKMETKVPVVEYFLSSGDDILLGGAIANTFIAASGFDVGKSKYEKEMVNRARQLMLQSKQQSGATIHLPSDVVVANEASESASTRNLLLKDVAGDMSIFDVGTATIKKYTSLIRASRTIIWNGPLGLYELQNFSDGTKQIAEAVQAATKSGAFSVIGGGDTIDFHTRYGYELSAYSFVSTGGGAMLEFVSGKPLPALEALAA